MNLEPLDEARTARVMFLDYHRPAMPPGLYTMDVQQDVSGPRIAADSFPTQWQFTVAGDRFTLRPSDVYAVFPPDGSLGDHSDVLPHAVLTRSTMPWEYRADGASAPWLAVLLFTEDEQRTQAYREPAITTLGQLIPATSAPQWPGLDLDPAEHQDSDKVTVLDVQQRLLATLLPSAAEVSLLTHVRRAEDTDGNLIDDERSVVLGRRLPRSGGISVVHLVSVESRYHDGSFDFGTAAPDDYIRLISLKSWRFACADPAGDFTGLLTGLDRTPAALRLPPAEDPEAERHLAAGSVPLPHHLRPGRSTVSWYRGPLIPCDPPDELDLPVQSSAELIRYDPTLGLFDASYATAWELGRLLALRSQQLSASLYAWKRANAQAVRSAEANLLHPAWAPPDPVAALPPDVAAWFGDLRLLRGVPLRYLVPDERLLPPESIRFVRVDPVWADCLLDGAFSLGRLTGRLKPVDREQKSTLVDAVPAHPVVSGFLLRSSLVSGWPGLLVDGYDTGPGGQIRGVETLRRDLVAPDVLLCLFAGDVVRVEIHQRPEALHFGPAELPGDWRGADGVVDLDALVGALRTGPAFTSADFAARTVEGVPRVTFVRS
ncbi:hypothetical protein [Rugosimonospora africana]|uniref:Uncharacterized protein n=1 Tax=Rugosimonospora africana TaxID=556532 RepID=A0A8J3QSF9_9ACTN|nr:hypothetical protein [Rugosimonospora africana]GIH15127.1 hypothetical protein Raf01_32990 [Rugosimonospora africana]